MSYLKAFGESGFRYDHLIGTGGIGAGIFFKLLGNHTLGRNESRQGMLLNNKDYCKLHIIIHYIAVLLGTMKGYFSVFPIGRIGDDPEGLALYREMESLGMDMKNVIKTPGLRTLFSVCFQYLDSSGGNITSSNSVSSKLTGEDIDSFFTGFEEDPGKEIILAVPEVPLKSRLRLLEIGRARGSFNVCSIASFEIGEFNKENGFEMVDLITLNEDEAGTIAEIYSNAVSIRIVSFNTNIRISNTIKSCISFLTRKNNDMMIAITDGSNGSYAYYNGSIDFIPAFNVGVKSTAGAGDAYLAGVICGICCGLPFLRKENLNTDMVLSSSVELGSILASLSVTGRDTINREIDADYLRSFIEKNKIILDSGFNEIFR